MSYTELLRPIAGDALGGHLPRDGFLGFNCNGKENPMEQFTRLLINLLVAKRVDFEGPSADSSARALIAQQAQLYEKLATTFQNVPYASRVGSGHVAIHPLADHVFKTLSKTLTSSPPTLHVESKNRATVESTLPLLEDQEVHQLADFVRNAEANQRTPEEAKQLPLMAAAAILVETATSIKKPLIALADLEHEVGPTFLVQMARYIADKKNQESRPELENALREEVNSAVAAVQNYHAEFAKERDDHRNSLDILTKATANLEDKLAKSESAIEEFGTELNGRENALREEWNLTRARLNWNTRYREARIGFAAAAALLTVFLGVTIGAAYYFGSDIVSAVTRFDLAISTNGGSIGVALSNQITRLLVFSVPVVVYLWMLKAVMRFFMRSMLLMDDARQRETMLETYFLLTEKGRADERDRPLILWALFRQTPGHGPDGVEPPDFTEAINAGLSRSKMQV